MRASRDIIEVFHPAVEDAKLGHHVIEGNHEWYQRNIEKHSWPNAIAEHGFHNVHTGQLLLEEEKIAIIGTTLWTDFFGGNPIAMFDVSQCLNDYRLPGNRPWLPKRPPECGIRIRP